MTTSEILTVSYCGALLLIFIVILIIGNDPRRPR